MDACSSAILPFSFGNTLFGRVRSKKSKLLVSAEIRYLDLLGYGEFNGAIHFFCCRRETPFLVNKSNEEQLLALQPYGSRHFEIETCGQHGFFILLR